VTTRGSWAASASCLPRLSSVDLMSQPGDGEPRDIPGCL
jgi:hypothetical protein